MVLVLLCFMGTVGCSSVNHYRYYTPQAADGEVSGPLKQPCGFARFGNTPDRITLFINNNKMAIEAYQDLDVYLFGPWFVSVIPVFPISWVIDLFYSNNLAVAVYGDESFLSKLKSEQFEITIQKADKSVEIIRSSHVNIGGREARVIFPMNYREVDHFVLLIKDLTNPGQITEVLFKNATRWEHYQITVNC